MPSVADALVAHPFSGMKWEDLSPEEREAIIECVRRGHGGDCDVCDYVEVCPDPKTRPYFRVKMTMVKVLFMVSCPQSHRSEGHGKNYRYWNDLATERAFIEEVLNKELQKLEKERYGSSDYKLEVLREFDKDYRGYPFDPNVIAYACLHTSFLADYMTKLKKLAKTFEEGTFEDGQIIRDNPELRLVFNFGGNEVLVSVHNDY